MAYWTKMLTFLQRNVIVLDHLGHGSQNSTCLVMHKGTKYIMKLYMASIEEPSYFTTRNSMNRGLKYSKKYAQREEKILKLLGCNDHLLCIKEKGTWLVNNKYNNQSHSFQQYLRSTKKGILTWVIYLTKINLPEVILTQSPSCQWCFEIPEPEGLIIINDTKP